MDASTRIVGSYAGPAYANARLPLQLGRLVQCKLYFVSTEQQHLLNLEPGTF